LNCVSCHKDLFYEYYDVKGQPYCRDCNSPRVCVGCGAVIPADVVVFKTFEGKNYHTDCYRCASCMRSLSKVGPNPHMGKLYCPECGEICEKCKLRLENHPYTEFEDSKYHVKCFTCCKCNTQLPEEFFLLDNKPACGKCAGQ